jgi:PAS domain S-box-containing protein
LPIARKDEIGNLIGSFNNLLETLASRDKELRDLNENFRYIAENSKDVIWHLDLNFCFDYVSPSVEHIRGSKQDEILGKPMWSMLKPEVIERVKQSNKLRIEEEQNGSVSKSYRYELEELCKDGSWIWTEVITNSHRDQNGKLIGFYGITRDISERKKTEEEIKSLLGEKELILREVHHRIKNNMSTIFGLLTLQAESLNDESAVSALGDAGNRVQSMMVLYDKLYRSSDFQKLSIEEFLPSLVDEIVKNFPNSGNVKIECRVFDVVLESRKLQPFVLIINELLTNIMKYAFVGRNGGNIKVDVGMIMKPKAAVSLVIEDDGNGIPETVDIEKSTGFGLQLVWMLVQELKGTIQIERGAGTKFILEFGM